MASTMSYTTEYEICEALGLKNVRKFNLSMGIGEATIATVEYFPEADGVKAVIPILKKFKLTPIED